mgnify:CR=1 FL=1|jgi:hypothetical protein
MNKNTTKPTALEIAMKYINKLREIKKAKRKIERLMKRK